MTRKLGGVLVALALIAGVFAATTAADVSDPEPAEATTWCGYNPNPQTPFANPYYDGAAGQTSCPAGLVFGVTQTCVEWFVSIFGGPPGWNLAYAQGGYQCNDHGDLLDAGDALCPLGPNTNSVYYRTVRYLSNGTPLPSQSRQFWCNSAGTF